MPLNKTESKAPTTDKQRKRTSQLRKFDIPCAWREMPFKNGDETDAWLTQWTTINAQRIAYPTAATTDDGWTTNRSQTSSTTTSSFSDGIQILLLRHENFRKKAKHERR